MPSGTRTIKYGPIGLDNIATEFKRNLKDVRLGDYYKENLALQPIDTSVNMKIPYGPAREGNPISVGDFYGAAWYKGQFECGGRGETQSTYHTNNDGYLFFRLIGCSSPTMRVIISGVGSPIEITGNGYDFTSPERTTILVGNTSGSATYTIQYTDCRGTWYRSITIYYGGAETSTTIDLLNEAPANSKIRL